MGFLVGVGESDFAQLREEKAYYVDKTEILYELVHDTRNKVTLFTRPRRFGKTLMMSMMENFFNVRKSSRDIFEGLAISGHEEFCEEWMNQYPVLFVSFKDVEGEDFDSAYEMLKVRIADISRDLSALSGGGQVNKYDLETFDRLQAGKGTLS